MSTSAGAAVLDELGRYVGPVVDAHHHLWELGDGRYPWLRPGVTVPHRYGDYSAAKHDYTAADLLRDVAGLHVVATVSMEAEYDPADPVAETRWLAEVAGRTGVPGAMAVQVRLDADDVEDVLTAQTAVPGVRSVRHKPGGPGRPADVGPGHRTLMSDPRWRAGYARLAEHGLHFELQTPWWNLDEAAALAADHPETLVVVNHAGVLLDHRDATIDGWRRALERVSGLQNVVVKASGLCIAGVGWEPAVNRDVLATLLDLFGADRVLFGSNFPVDGIFCGYAELLDHFRTALVDRSAAEQRALFHDTAVRVYHPHTIVRHPTDPGEELR